MIKCDVTFVPETHKYYAKCGKELISVSKLVSLFKPPFDPTGEIITRYAAKHGKTVEQVRKEWDYERDSASDRGNSFHKQAEHWVKTQEIKDDDYKDVVEQVAKINFEGKLHAETMIAAEDLNIAGTVDLIVEKDGNRVDVWDYKTNKALKKKSFWKNGSYSYMLPPVNHIMDSNYYHYSLQQEIYAIILEEHGYWVNNRNLIYINPKTRLIEIHPVMPLRKEALAIIKYFNAKLNW